jgi:hypothetical protein
MKLFKFIFLISSFFFFISEILKELYFTATVQLILSLAMLYVASKISRGRISRLLLLTLFFLSYPGQIFIMSNNLSTHSSIDTWLNSSFVFSDMQNAFIITLSASFYLMFMLIHNIFSIILYEKETEYKYIGNVFNSFKIKNNLFKTKKNINNNYNLYLCLLFFVLSLILIVQNKFGWGVHGLPPFSENIYRLVGLSIYLRDYLIPIFLVFFLTFAPKINFLFKLILLFFSILVPATSLSKVSIIFYFLILFYAIFRDKILLPKKVFTFFNNLRLALLFAWLIFVYFFILYYRTALINQGTPINNQLILIINYSNIINFENYISLINFINFYSLIERFLGFKELASVIYFKEIINHQANFSSLLGLGSFLDTSVSFPRDFTSNFSPGGVGFDWISALVTTGYYMLIPIFLISLCFFFQILIIKNLPININLIAEFLMMIIFIRFAVDGNFSMIKWYTCFLAFALFLLLLSKYYWKKYY